MKTRNTIYVLAIFLGLQFNTVFAAGNLTDSAASYIPVSLATISIELAPTAPKEATFEENTLQADGAPLAESNIILIAPVTPGEADFEDELSNTTAVCINMLAPVTPKVAEFEETL